MVLRAALARPAARGQIARLIRRRPAATGIRLAKPSCSEEHWPVPGMPEYSFRKIPEEEKFGFYGISYGMCKRSKAQEQRTRSGRDKWADPLRLDISRKSRNATPRLSVRPWVE